MVFPQGKRAEIFGNLVLPFFFGRQETPGASHIGGKGIQKRVQNTEGIFI